MHLHGLAVALVEVLAGQVEVELRELERLVAAGQRHVAALAHDLDRGAEVLKDGAGVEVGDRHPVRGALLLGVEARDQVDGRLVRALGTGGVGGQVQAVPSGRALWEGGKLVSNGTVQAISCSMLSQDILTYNITAVPKGVDGHFTARRPG